MLDTNAECVDDPCDGKLHVSARHRNHVVFHLGLPYLPQRYLGFTWSPLLLSIPWAKVVNAIGYQWSLVAEARKKGKRSRSLNADPAGEEKKKVIFGQRQVGANYQARSLQEHGFLPRDPVMAGSDALKQREPSFGLVARLLQRTTCIRSTRLEPQTEVYEFVQFLYRKPGHR
jgi:hypothetical protein